MPVRLLLLLVFASLPALAQPPDSAQMKRGEELFAAKCAMCHQINGTGVPPVYPPLAASDWLMADRKRAIRVLCEGLEGPITVSGVNYANAMPAQILADQQVADVMTYITNSWGNAAPPFEVGEVEAERRHTKFPTYDALLKATAFQPLPAPPTGLAVREIAPLPEFCTRLASRGNNGPVYALGQRGTVYLVDRTSNALQPIIPQASYLGQSRREIGALGFVQATDGRLYIATNERIVEGVDLVQSEVIIWRTTAEEGGHPAKPEPWFKVRYPYGVGPYNHGVNCLGFGPDGMLYVNSGSRTDGGEPGSDPKYFQDGETDITACIWRLDPKAAEPKVEVIARGIRNAWGFAWDREGNFFAATNGPDASAPEEMDFIQPGKHYGFPYQFADWPVKKAFPYPHTPAPPEGVEFAHPVLNLGPAAGGAEEKPLASFDAHSSPGGMIWCGDDWPEAVRHGFLVTRYGNLLGPPAAPEDVGFDLLFAKMQRRADGVWTMRTTTVLAPLGRPLDIVSVGPGRAWILEYTRPTNFRDKLGWLPGRVIELTAKASATR
jgi:mono/diheme cytochrome c family protein